MIADHLKCLFNCFGCIKNGRRGEKNNIGDSVNSVPSKDGDPGGEIPICMHCLEQFCCCSAWTPDAKRVCHIAKLPSEMLEMIFSYLSVNDRLKAALVCTDWLDCLCSPKLLEDVSVHITSGDVNLNEECEFFTRPFSFFTLSHCEISLEFVKFLQQKNTDIKKLVFNSCGISPCLDLYNPKVSCENLISLKFYMCYINLFHSLPELREFHVELYGNGVNYIPRYFTASDITWLDDTMPKLECLYVRVNNCIRVPEEWNMETDEEESDVEADRSRYSYYGSTIDLPIVVDFIEKHSQTLKEITIIDQSLVTLHRVLYDKLFNMPGLKLKNLWFGHLASFVDQRTAIEICRKFSTLRELCFIAYPMLDDPSLKAICHLLPDLEDLMVEGDIDNSVEDIFKLKNLRSLTFCHCYIISNQSFHKAASICQMHKLTKLKIYNTAITDLVLREVLSKLRKLRSFKMNNQGEFRYCKLSNETMRFISKNLTHLDTLIIFDGNISDKGILCPHDPEQSIFNLRGLRELKLMNQSFTCEGLLWAISFLELRVFHFDDFVASAGYKNAFINKLIAQNPSLKDLKMIPPRWRPQYIDAIPLRLVDNLY